MIHIVVTESTGSFEDSTLAAGGFLVFYIIRLDSIAFDDVMSHFAYIFTFHN